MKRVPQAFAPQPEQSTCPLHGPARRFDFRGPWFRTDEAAAYVGCKHACGCPNAKGFYDWRKRRGVENFGGLISKADIDTAILERRRSA